MGKILLEGREVSYEIKENGCWYVINFKPNQLPNGRLGYYLIRVHPEVRRYVHRMVLEQKLGKSIAGWLVRHKCNDPLCINPKHLEKGTYQDNSIDAVKVNAFTHKVCRNGHDLTLEGATKIVRRSGRNPHNKCVVCEKIRKQ